MSNIYIFKNGEIVPAKIERSFGTHGAYLLEGQRLDALIKVQLLLDSSTTSTYQTGVNVSTAKTGNLIGRAIVGGVLLGGVGAAIGGLSGNREENINTQSTEINNTELTAELFFNNDKSMYVLLDSKEVFHWLLSFVNQPPLTDAELQIEKEKADAELQIKKEMAEIEKEKAKKDEYKIAIKKAKSKAFPLSSYKLRRKKRRKNNKQDLELELLNLTYKIFSKLPDYTNIDYEQFVLDYKEIQHLENQLKLEQNEVSNFRKMLLAIGIVTLLISIFTANVLLLVVSLIWLGMNLHKPAKWDGLEPYSLNQYAIECPHCSAKVKPSEVPYENRVIVCPECQKRFAVYL